jgi:hypothetical protein
MIFSLFLEKISNTWMHFRIIKIWITWFTTWTSITLTNSFSDTQLQVIMWMQFKSIMFLGLRSTMTCSLIQICPLNIGLDTSHREQTIKATQELDLHSCMHRTSSTLKKYLINLHLHLKYNILWILLLLCMML